MIVDEGQLASPSPQNFDFKISKSLDIGGACVSTGKSGRKVLVVRAGDGQHYATDLHCFHMGGELGVPAENPSPLCQTQRYSVDIEDGHFLKCPMHGRKIDLRTGEEVGDLGRKQRVHECRVDQEGYVLVDKRSVTHSDNLRFASDDYNQNTGGMQAPRVRKATAAIAAKRAKPAPSTPSTQSTMHRFLTPAAAHRGAILGEDTQEIDLTPGDGFDARMADVIDLTNDRVDLLSTQPDDDLPPTQPYGDLSPTQPYGDDLPPTQPYGDDIPPTQPDEDVDMG